MDRSRREKFQNPAGAHDAALTAAERRAVLSAHPKGHCVNVERQTDVKPIGHRSIIALVASASPDEGAP